MYVINIIDIHPITKFFQIIYSILFHVESLDKKVMQMCAEFR